jgi:hypothetical protein
MAKRDEVLGLRLNAAELDALKALAEKEARSPASWLRFRVKQEAERWGVPIQTAPAREGVRSGQSA